MTLKHRELYLGYAKLTSPFTNSIKKDAFGTLEFNSTFKEDAFVI